MIKEVTSLITQHAAGDGESERGPSCHPPAGGEIRQLCPQHLHDHLVVQCQIEVVLIQKLFREHREEEQKRSTKVLISGTLHTFINISVLPVLPAG